MARRRFKAFWQRPLPMLTVLVGVVAVGYWIRGSSRHKDQQAIPLMGEFNPEAAAKPALERIVPSPAVVPVSEDPLPQPQKLETPQTAKPAPDANAVVVVPAPPTTQPSAATSRPAVTQDTTAPGSDLHAALAAKERNDLLAARQQLNRAIQAGLSADQLAVARQAMADVAEKTVFSPAVVANDPLTETYKVVSGDVLARLAKRYKVSEDLLSDINHLNNKHFIREGLRMKMVHGPFHASISKSTHELHIYLQDVYLRSYRVALGANGKTPVGRWRVDNHQANPGWTDPRTGKKWHPDDPANPIGEYWIGLKGVEGEASEAFGYGIHGTIEPQTIGQDVSLGCIRLAPDDIAAVYKLLVPGESFVTIGE